ncbi:hypothetical protein U0070_000007 [Myodes glareolus]|uniref:Uncharacterized protein n=1 Tax=Myodes glareolus TaxID=447135 RepID=A0AAW0HVT9_MYOGA
MCRQRKWMQRFNRVLNCTLIAAVVTSPAWGGSEEKPGGPFRCWGPRTDDVLGRHYYRTVLPTLRVHQNQTELEPDVELDIESLHWRQRQTDPCELADSLVYTVSSR